jgi:hypothetical protein
MIFAELQYGQPYSDVHAPLVELLGRNFPDIDSGLQGDSWVWILDAGLRVSVDTFTSMHHQVKSPRPSRLLDQVLAILASHYELRLMVPPMPEGDEDPDES